MKRIFTILLCFTTGLVVAQSRQIASVVSTKAAISQMHNIEQTTLEIPLSQDKAYTNFNLAQLMNALHVPGLSIAVISNYKIVFTKGYGVIAPGSSKAVTPATLFQAASVSKPVTAMASIVLVDRNLLSLEEDVNHYLKTWKVPSNPFTEQHPVTLRELISHRAGVNVHGFAGYNRNSHVPTITQILDGKKPANNPPIRVVAVPGENESYSGGGIVIEQLLLTNVMDRPFSSIMKNLVLDKLKMSNSTFTQPLQGIWRSKAATGTNSNGNPVSGQWFVYPEQGPAGLWTTPTDLAKFAIGLAQAQTGSKKGIISQSLAKSMITPFVNGGAQCFHLDPLNMGLYSHNGQNEGFESYLVMNWKTGNGLVLLANSDNADHLWDLLLQKVSREFDWNYNFEHKPKIFLLVAQLRGVDALLKYFDAIKASGVLEDEAGESDLNQIGYFYLGSDQTTKALLVFRHMVQLYPSSADAYDSLAEGYMKAGDKTEAKAYYSKSLRLNPKNDNAREKLLELQR